MQENSEGALSRGETINDTYQVQFFIGQGAFGEVYRVKHKYLGIQVLKLFKDDYIKRVDIETVTREAKILAKITHPNIVRVFETNTFNKAGTDFYFMTMGFVSGETLAQLLRRKINLPLQQALSIQKDILTGLSVTHSQKPPIIHRDISPDNILLSYDREDSLAMISDFGLAQFFDSSEHIAKAAGKYLFFAPECFWDAYLPASDVFAAAVVFYKMITGVHPWEYNITATKDEPEEIATQVIAARKQNIRKPSDFCGECSQELDKVILKALNKNLERRFANATDFLCALNDLPDMTNA